MRLVARADQGHSSLADELGFRNAGVDAARAVVAVRDELELEAPPNEHRLSGWHATVNTGLAYRGGVGYGVLPGRVAVDTEVRLLPGMERAAVTSAFERTLRAVAGRTGAALELAFDAPPNDWLPATLVEPQHPLAAAAEQACAAVLGHVPAPAVFPGTTDATWFAELQGIADAAGARAGAAAPRPRRRRVGVDRRDAPRGRPLRRARRPLLRGGGMSAATPRPAEGGGPRSWPPTLAPVGGVLAVLAIAAVTTPDLYERNNLTLILFLAGLIGVTAVGQTIVLLTGGIDLSIGAVIGLTTVIVATQTDGRGSALPGAIALALLAGLAVGAANAGLVLLREVPPFVATFATFVLVQGAITAWTRGAPSGEIPDALAPIGAEKLAGIPVPLWLFAAIAAVAAVVLSRTSLGRRLYATGANRRATSMSGVRTGHADRRRLPRLGGCWPCSPG